jgi:hypothetical protein
MSGPTFVARFTDGEVTTERNGPMKHLQNTRIDPIAVMLSNNKSRATRAVTSAGSIGRMLAGLHCPNCDTESSATCVEVDDTGVTLTCRVCHTRPLRIEHE